jgi:hypothetical protein
MMEKFLVEENLIAWVWVAKAGQDSCLSAIGLTDVLAEGL